VVGSALGYGLRLGVFDGGDSVDRAVEGDDTADAGALGTGEEIGLGEVRPVDLIHLDRAQKCIAIHDGESSRRRSVIGDRIVVAICSRGAS
jgi:hypothetical protein